MKKKGNTDLILLAIIGIIAVVSLVIIFNGTGTGAAGYDKDDNDEGGKYSQNYLAAKIFSINSKVCVKKPKGSSKWYVAYHGEQGGFSPDNPSENIVPCSSKRDCQNLGKEAKCDYVQHVMLPEMGVIVQGEAAPPAPVCGNGILEAPHEVCEFEGDIPIGCGPNEQCIECRACVTQTDPCPVGEECILKTTTADYLGYCFDALTCMPYETACTQTGEYCSIETGMGVFEGVCGEISPLDFGCRVTP